MLEFLWVPSQDHSIRHRTSVTTATNAIPLLPPLVITSTTTTTIPYHKYRRYTTITTIPISTAIYIVTTITIATITTAATANVPVMKSTPLKLVTANIGLRVVLCHCVQSWTPPEVPDLKQLSGPTES